MSCYIYFVCFVIVAVLPDSLVFVFVFVFFFSFYCHNVLFGIDRQLRVVLCGASQKSRLDRRSDTDEPNHTENGTEQQRTV